MEHDKYAVYIIILVAIVGLVSLVGLTMSEDLSGQGFKALNNRQNVLGSGVEKTEEVSSSFLIDDIDYLYTCSETDIGYDIDTLGVLSYGGFEVSDVCDEEGNLMEWSCDDCGGALITQVQCDAGCNNGACNSLEVAGSSLGLETGLSACRETDDGHDVYEYSTLVYDKDTTEIREDECLDTNTIREYWCFGEGEDLTFSYTDDACPDGYVCSGGECVSESCIDEDGGRDYYEKGKISFGLDSDEDECVNEFKVKEYWCKNDDERYVNINKICPTGYSCDDGACVSMLAASQGP